MKLLTWIDQRFRRRNNVQQPPCSSTDNILFLMQSMLGVTSSYQGHLDNLSALQVTADNEAEALRFQEQVDSTAKQAVEGMSAALRQWADWLADPSRPMPMSPTACPAAVLSPEATNAVCPAVGEVSKQVTA